MYIEEHNKQFHSIAEWKLKSCGINIYREVLTE